MLRRIFRSEREKAKEGWKILKMKTFRICTLHHALLRRSNPMRWGRHVACRRKICTKYLSYIQCLKAIGKSDIWLHSIRDAVNSAGYTEPNNWITVISKIGKDAEGNGSGLLQGAMLEFAFWDGG